MYTGFLGVASRGPSLYTLHVLVRNVDEFIAILALSVSPNRVVAPVHLSASFAV